MPLSDDDLRARLAGQTWTSHNVRLSPAVTTIPGQPDFFETDLRLQAIERVLEMLYGNLFSYLRIADLGCLEGGFAAALARRGARVVGLEARQQNIEKAELLKEHFGLDGMQLALADVKDFTLASFGTFDVVLALGILYHLDEPVTWLRQLAEATTRVLIVDTHFAPLAVEAGSAVDSRLNLGEIVPHDAPGGPYEGRWLSEFEETAPPEDFLWASYSNSRSFWLTKESLLRAITQAGFDLVFEQHDYLVPFHRHFTTEFFRTMIVAVKRQARAG